MVLRFQGSQTQVGMGGRATPAQQDVANTAKKVAGVLFRISAAANLAQRVHAVDHLLGPHSFSAGMLAGLETLHSNDHYFDPARLAEVFVWAEVQDCWHEARFWRCLSGMKNCASLSSSARFQVQHAVAGAQGQAFGSAAGARKHLLLALCGASDHHAKLLIGLDLAQRQRWQRFVATSPGLPRLAGDFQLGRILGHLLGGWLLILAGRIKASNFAAHESGLLTLLQRLRRIHVIPPSATAAGGTGATGATAGAAGSSGTANGTAVAAGRTGSVEDEADEAGDVDEAENDGRARKDDVATCPGSCALTPYPVDVINGCKVLIGPAELDFCLPAPLAISWQRSYSSDNPNVGWLGQGWHLPVSLALAFDQRSITLLDPQYRQIRFPQLKTGESFYSRFEQMTLRRIDMFNFELVDRNKLRHLFVLQSTGGSQARLVAQHDANGNRIRIEYNAQQQPVALHDSMGRHFVLTFDARNRLSCISLMRAADMAPVALVYYDHDEAGDLVRVRDGIGTIRREFRYKNHILVAHAEPDGVAAEYDYNEYFPAGRVVANRVNTGQSWQFTYARRQTMVTDQAGRRVMHQFDDDRRYTGQVNAQGGKEIWRRDRFGKVVAFIDSNGAIERYEYDERGRVCRTEAADGSATLTSWDDACDKPKKVTDALGGITQYEYDGAGNLAKRTDALGRVTHYRHDAQGLLLEVIDARGGHTRMNYNASGQLTTLTDCSGHTTTHAYDADGILCTTTDALGNTMEYVHDDEQRQCIKWHADDNRESFAYDALGRMVQHTDGNGFDTFYAWEAAGQLIRRTNALGGRLEYRYDQSQRLIQLINENGAVHSFAYDALDRLIAETGFDQRSIQYQRDAEGRVVHKLEAGRDGNPQAQIETAYQYDVMGRLLEENIRCGSEVLTTRYRYDGLGQLVLAANGSSMVRRTYDAMGQLIGEQSRTGNNITQVRYRYDELGNRIQTILPDGRICNYLYGGSGHVHQINLDGEVISDFERDDIHQETGRTQGALTTRWQYDAVGRLILQEVRPNVVMQNATMARGSADGTTLDLTPLRQAQPDANLIGREYTYDEGGNLTGLHDHANGRSAYAYDPLGRIVAATQSHLAEKFAFDPAHNLLDADHVTSRTMDNRLVRYGECEYQYDSHGNLVARKTGPDTLLRLQWNARHQLVQSQTGDENGTATEYGYDPFGRRVFKRDASGETHFVWDGDRLLAETKNGQSRVWLYEDDSCVPLAQVVTTVAAAVTGAPEMRSHKVRRLQYVHIDHLGTPREMSDEAGKLQWRFQSKVWGKAMPETAMRGEQQPLRFQGQYFDAETGLHYNRFRYYDPEIGRFISQDPIGLDGGENPYQYAPNPLGWIDPLGLTRGHNVRPKRQAKELVARRRRTVSDRPCRSQTQLVARARTNTDAVQRTTERLSVVRLLRSRINASATMAQLGTYTIGSYAHGRFLYLNGNLANIAKVPRNVHEDALKAAIEVDHSPNNSSYIYGGSYDSIEAYRLRPAVPLPRQWHRRHITTHGYGPTRAGSAPFRAAQHALMTGGTDQFHLAFQNHLVETFDPVAVGGYGHAVISGVVTHVQNAIDYARDSNFPRKLHRHHTTGTPLITAAQAIAIKAAVNAQIVALYTAKFTAAHTYAVPVIV